MELHIFRAKGNTAILGVTKDKKGSNLPTNISISGEWIYWKTKDIREDVSVLGGVSKEVIRQVNEVEYDLIMRKPALNAHKKY